LAPAGTDLGVKLLNPGPYGRNVTKDRPTVRDITLSVV
jgi:hypothetical protein